MLDLVMCGTIEKYSKYFSFEHFSYTERHMDPPEDSLPCVEHSYPIALATY